MPAFLDVPQGSGNGCNRIYFRCKITCPRVPAHQQVFVDRQTGQNSPALRHQHEALANSLGRAHVRDILAIEVHRARRRRNNAKQCLE